MMEYNIALAVALIYIIGRIHYIHKHVHDTDYSHLDEYMVIVTTMAGFDTTVCGCEPWIKRVLPVSMHVLQFVCGITLTCTYHVISHLV